MTFEWIWFSQIIESAWIQCLRTDSFKFNISKQHFHAICYFNFFYKPTPNKRWLGPTEFQQTNVEVLQAEVDSLRVEVESLEDEYNSSILGEDVTLEPTNSSPEIHGDVLEEQIPEQIPEPIEVLSCEGRDGEEDRIIGPLKVTLSCVLVYATTWFNLKTTLVPIIYYNSLI